MLTRILLAEFSVDSALSSVYYWSKLMILIAQYEAARASGEPVAAHRPIELFLTQIFPSICAIRHNCQGYAIHCHASARPHFPFYACSVKIQPTTILSPHRRPLSLSNVSGLVRAIPAIPDILNLP
jgi:hypothetical protein